MTRAMQTRRPAARAARLAASRLAGERPAEGSAGGHSFTGVQPLAAADYSRLPIAQCSHNQCLSLNKFGWQDAPYIRPPQAPQHCPASVSKSAMHAVQQVLTSSDDQSELKSQPCHAAFKASCSHVVHVAYSFLIHSEKRPTALPMPPASLLSAITAAQTYQSA